MSFPELLPQLCSQDPKLGETWHLHWEGISFKVIIPRVSVEGGQFVHSMMSVHVCVCVRVCMG